jgi:apolipoprotein N-acyltransferase
MASPVLAQPRQEVASVTVEGRPGEQLRSTRAAWLVWLAPLAGAGLLWLSVFPVACGWLAWFALVPVLTLVRSPARPRLVYLSAYLAGLAFYLPALAWMSVADPRMVLTWLALALYLSVYFPFSLYLTRVLERRTPLPLVVSLPLAWLSLEYLRYGAAGSFVSALTGSYQHDVPGGFGWYLLAHTQHDFLELLQLADLTGAWGVSLLLCLVNALLFEVLYARRWFRAGLLGQAGSYCNRVALLVQGLVVVGLLLAALGYGRARLAEEAATPGPRLALIQTNLDQRLRNQTIGRDEEAREKARESVTAQVNRLCDEAARHGVDLVVLPETSLMGVWEEIAPGVPTLPSQRLALRLARRCRANVLGGISAGELGADNKVYSYNSALLIGRDGRRLGRYDKIHRVPFGEYIPLQESVPVLKKLAPYDFDYTVDPGKDHPRLPLAAGGKRFTFGAVICYEDTDPAMARPYAGADGKPPADFLINISNDGWFDGTSEHDQHLAICRFRAVECRRAVARSVNMGISALIDPSGRVRRPRPVHGSKNVWEVPAGPADNLPLAEYDGFKKVAGVLLATVPIDRRSSPYARWGDWLPVGCAFLLVLSLASALRRRGRPTLRLHTEG